MIRPFRAILVLVLCVLLATEPFHASLQAAWLSYDTNNPLEASNITTLLSSSWATQGRYIVRPYGMELYRPGASRMYHWPRSVDEVYTVLHGDAELPTLAPGAPERHLNIQYQGRAAGEVASLQTEDKTWVIFEWKTGDLLEIVPPSGQPVTFAKQDAGTVNISAAGRNIRMHKNTGERIDSITDPLGRAVKYEYDQYQNLIAVTDRSGRKRFYIYDTPEAFKLFPENKKLTGLNIHYLVDVRVDDDADGTAHFPGDTIPVSTNEKLQGSNPFYQNYPGDVSILQVSYEGGMMKGIETAAGSVAIDHKLDGGGQGGTEVVRDGATGAATTVAYGARARHAPD